MAKSISIVIPAHNEERFIAACLDAIAAQTEQPDEVIVVDNGCTDDTIAIASRYSFVRIIREPRIGILHARNAGFDAATCDIIGRIDADSILPASWVAWVRRFYSHKVNAGKALTGGVYFYNLRLPRFNGWLQGLLAYRLNRFVVGHYLLLGSNMAMPRHFWGAVRDQVCPRTDLHEDLDLAMHLHDVGFKIHYQENLRVGVYLKRVFHDRNQLRKHLRRWPLTLKAHHYDRAWFGNMGNVFLWIFAHPSIVQVFRKPTRFDPPG
jgi:glycosyltransferase involved in cell wall biosynthesis